MTDTLSLSTSALPCSYGEIASERAALGSQNAVVPLVDFALLTLSGADVLPYLQTKLTADTRTWSDGGLHYTTVVNINGQMLCDAWAWVEGQHTYLLAPTAHAGALAAHLDRYVIMEDVSITTSAFHGWAIGAQVEAAAEATLVDGSCSYVPGTERVMWAAEADAVAVRAHVDAMASAGELVLVGSTALAMAQVDAGVAVFGVDLFPEKTIPLEAGLWHGVSFRKGCYLGQEVIERLFSRGRPNKRLMCMRWIGDAAAPGTELLNEQGKAMGVVTRSYADGDAVSALGYVKRKALDDRTILLHVNGSAVTIAAYAGGESPTL